jgi:hypothetical protein
VSLEDVCRPGPVFLPPPLAGLSSRIIDSFDHGRERESGDGMEILPGGEEKQLSPLKYQSRCYSVESVVSSKPAAIHNDGSRLSLSSVEGLSSGCPTDLSDAQGLHVDGWKCDYATCVRVFQKRHELK